MKTSGFSEAQIVVILKQDDADLTVKCFCWEHGISDASHYNWKVKYRLILAFILLIGLLPQVAWTGEISIGATTKIWPFMWFAGRDMVSSKLKNYQKLKWETEVNNLKKYQEINAKHTIVDLWQERDGADNFMRADAIVGKLKSYGIRPILRLYEGLTIWDHLEGKESPKWGYSREYYEWVKAIASRYKADIDLYLISNEVELGIGHRYKKLPSKKVKKYVKYGQYVKLLNTAYKAIKSVDRNLKVADHGVAGYSIGLSTALALYEREGVERAMDFWNNEFMVGRQPVRTNKNSFSRFITSSGTKQRVDFVRGTFSMPGSHDLHQLHHYHGWKSLPVVLEHLNDLAPSGPKKPIIVTELGYLKRPNRKLYSEEEHAKTIAKDILLLACEGIEHIGYWGVRWTPSPGLKFATLYKSTKDPYQFISTRMLSAYGHIAKTLNGLHLHKKKEFKSNDIFGCSFTGKDNVEVLWSDGGEIELNLADYGYVPKITNIYGVDVKPRQEVLKVGMVPLFLHLN